MMETVFYEDHHHQYPYNGMNNLKDREQLKRKMTLDLESPNLSNSNKTSVIKKAKYFTTNNGNSLQTPIFQNVTKIEVLSSPDYSKVATPELERLILDPQSLITPTPHQAQVFFPKNVTEAQEDYAKGFSDALAQLQSQNQLNGDSQNTHYTISNNMSGNTTLAFTQQIFNNSNSNSNNSINSDDTGSGSDDDDMSENSMTSSSTSTYTTNGQMQQHLRQQQQQQQQQGNYGRPPDYNSSIGHNNNGQVLTTFTGQSVIIKEEPQIVPTQGGNTAPVSPIDMVNQEKIKLDRKRHRNRIAASKCRKRKLERISKLEDKVKQIKAENLELINVSNKLREAVAELKKEVLKHQTCPIPIRWSDYDFSEFKRV